MKVPVGNPVFFASIQCMAYVVKEYINIIFSSDI